MTAALAGIGGLLFTIGPLLLGLRVRYPARLTRANFRGEPVRMLGWLLALPLLFGFVAGGTTRDAPVVFASGAVMGALGLLDDLYGDRTSSGFRGHLDALFRGTATTGFLKAIGGGVVGLWAARQLGWPGIWILAAGAVIALSANLCNLLDFRPGRAGKATLGAYAALAFAGGSEGVGAVMSGVAGGLVVFLPADLRERAMLGDAGANLLGAVAGAVAAASLGRGSLLICLGVLGALTLVSEFVSFDRVIERTPPLRAVDRLGRTPP